MQEKQNRGMRGSWWYEFSSVVQPVIQRISWNIPWYTWEDSIPKIGNIKASSDLDELIADGLLILWGPNM